MIRTRTLLRWGLILLSTLVLFCWVWSYTHRPFWIVGTPSGFWQLGEKWERHNFVRLWRGEIRIEFWEILLYKRAELLSAAEAGDVYFVQPSPPTSGWNFLGIYHRRSPSGSFPRGGTGRNANRVRTYYGLTIWSVPIGAVFAILILISALFILRPYRSMVRRRRIRAGLCPICGYDLRATPHRCPECGTEAKAGSA